MTESYFLSNSPAWPMSAVFSTIYARKAQYRELPSFV
jgi:hypothetical protein